MLLFPSLSIYEAKCIADMLSPHNGMRQHYGDVTMTTMELQITDICVQAHFKENIQSFATLAFVREINRYPVDSLHKEPETRKMSPFDDVTVKWRTRHYNDVIMSALTSQITNLTFVYSAVYSDTDKNNHQSSAPLAFVRGIHRWQRASNADNVSIWWRHHGY